ncbi:MAG: small multi-drug export protein [Oscillospiraceae bacterium]|nr:small multi-drug export protein [Oscillospiraceae bacterium]
MLSTTLGKFIMTFLISTLPVGELRFGLPYGILAGLKLPVAMIAAILGNMLPVPFIIMFIEQVFIWLRKHFPKMDMFISSMEKKAEAKQDLIDRYGKLGLILIVGIPLPGTGAWTGSLVAALMKMEMKKAIPYIYIGVVLAAILMTVITKLGIYAFF